MVMLFFVQNSNIKGLHKIESEDHLQSLQRQLALTAWYIFSFSLFMLYICGLLHWESTSFSRTDENQMIPKMVTSILESTKFQTTAFTLILLSTKLHPKTSTGQHPKHPLGKYKSNIIRVQTLFS